MIIKTFLEELYGFIEEDDFFYIWNKRNKQTLWLNNIDEAVKYSEEQSKKTGNDLYVCVGTGPDPKKIERIILDKEKGPEYKQFLETEIKKLTGFYLDIDIADENHKKLNLPQNIEEALKLLDTCWHKPTFLINSGYGLHCWWLFKEPFEIETEKDFNFIKERTRAFNNFFVKRAREQEREVDHLFDLKRLLRIPGTYNWKDPKNPKEVYFIKNNPELRYEVSDFEDIFDFNFETVTETKIRKDFGSSVKEIQDIIDEIDFEKKELNQDDMMNLELVFGPKFINLWEKKLDDNARFSSASEYDWNIASLCNRLGFSNQRIFQAMVSFRQKHNLDLKLNNKQYYARTIKDLKKTYDPSKDPLNFNKQPEPSVVSSEPESELKPEDNAQPDKKDSSETNLLEKNKTLIKKALSDKLNIKILKFIKYIEDPRPQYVLITDDNQKIFLGDVSQISSQNHFKKHILDAKNFCIPSYKKDAWDMIIQQLFDICEEISTGEENSSRAIILWLDEYLSEQPNIDKDEGCQTNSPFKDEGDWHIFIDNFYIWCVSCKNIDMKKNRFLTYLTMCGCKSIQKRYTDEKNNTSRKRVWKIPNSIFKGL